MTDSAELAPGAVLRVGATRLVLVAGDDGPDGPSRCSSPRLSDRNGTMCPF